MTCIKIAHIINPVIVNETSDLFTAQPITFATMQQAKEKAKNAVKVELYAACFPEDETLVPHYFKKVKPLDRSIRDIGDFNSEKKFPLLKDVLDRLYNASKAPYFIYTNVDIALTPQFYTEVKKIIAQGYDGFVINRRAIPANYSRVEEIPRMLAQVEKGEKHPGFDCFVFKRKAYKNYRLGQACIGANWFGRVMIANIIANASKFKIFEALAITFHIGDERPWLRTEYNELNSHNEDQLMEIFETLIDSPKTKNKELIKKFYMFNLENRKSQPRMMQSIISRNSPTYRLPDKPENIYHSEYRSSDSWEEYAEQRISQDPVFIVGYPRSGTTLVQALLATQENIVSFYETHFFSVTNAVIAIYDDRLLLDCLAAVIKKIRERIAFSKNAEEHIEKIARQPGLSVKMLFEIIIIDNLINKVDYKNIKNTRWLEKTPEHGLYLHLISRFYPRVKAIYVMRNPEKAIISRRLNFFFTNEAEWPIETHVQKWLDSVAAFEAFKAAHPGSAYVVRLEDITKDTKHEMKKICEFLDISFSSRRLKNYKEQARALVYPWEDWKRSAARDISGSMAAREDNHLSNEDRGKLISMAGSVMKKYGYYN